MRTIIQFRTIWFRMAFGVHVLAIAVGLVALSATTSTSKPRHDSSAFFFSVCPHGRPQSSHPQLATETPRWNLRERPQNQNRLPFKTKIFSAVTHGEFTATADSLHPRINYALGATINRIAAGLHNTG